MRTKYQGLIAAPFTAMREDGSVDPELIPEQANQLIRSGVGGAFICGTTGEGLSLTLEERRLVAQGWRDSTPAGFAVIVHVGHASVREARALAEHAAAIGCDGFAAMPSSPFMSSSVGDALRYSADVAAAAPELPFFYYHIPSVSQIRISMHDLLQAAGDTIPNLTGVKFTYEDLMDYSRCIHLAGGRFDVLFGRDELFLAGLAVGARAAVGSTYNFAAPLFHAITAAFEANDLETARELQHSLQEVVAVLMRFPGLAAQKHVMKRFGLELGPVRSPLRSLTKVEQAELDTLLDQIGFSSICEARVDSREQVAPVSK